ncbi:hypothetical protein JB92DRAFT_3119609 [Gautieria morchelliformis]|nr:hypothetical protein JB92DRAFT_3119609 [Gautieria morchelliformis]
MPSMMRRRNRSAGVIRRKRKIRVLQKLLGEGADIVNLSSEVDYGSVPASPTPSLPFLSSDPIFGDTRIDMDDSSRTSSPPPPPGPPSRQQIHLTDEDTTVRFVGQEVIQYRQRLWTLGSIITFGQDIGFRLKYQSLFLAFAIHVDF